MAILICLCLFNDRRRKLRLSLLLKTERRQHPRCRLTKPFDLTSTAFLIVAFLTGIAGALQTPTLSLFLTNEVHARPAMVGFFFTGSAHGIWAVSGRAFGEKGDRKNLIVCCLLGVFACVLLPGTAAISFCCLLGCS